MTQPTRPNSIPAQLAAQLDDSTSTESPTSAKPDDSPSPAPLAEDLERSSGSGLWWCVTRASEPGIRHATMSGHLREDPPTTGLQLLCSHRRVTDNSPMQYLKPSCPECLHISGEMQKDGVR